jgi:hypothetical protein
VRNFRKEIRTRPVDHTVDGVTNRIDQEYTVNVPVAPLDVEAAAFRAVTVLTVLVVAGAVVWSTVAIGSLLSTVAPPWTAYLVAGVFDLAWITALTLEWLSRYDDARADAPRRAGWLSLAVSMALIALHGYQQGHLIAGLCGSLVAAVSKSMWHLVMKHSSTELDPDTRGWLDKERSKITAQLARADAQRGLLRTTSRTDRLRLALESGQGSDSRVSDPEQSPWSIYRARILPDGSPVPTGLLPDGTPVPVPREGPHPPVVYFLRDGHRMKIGATVNIPQRTSYMRYSPDDVMLTLAGGHAYERAVHDRFAAYRIPVLHTPSNPDFYGTNVPSTEWFEFTGELRDFVWEHCPDMLVPDPGVSPDWTPDSGPRPDLSPESIPVSIRKSIKALVLERLDAGMTDPGLIVGDIVRERPDVKQDSVRRIIQGIRRPA